MQPRCYRTKELGVTRGTENLQFFVEGLLSRAPNAKYKSCRQIDKHTNKQTNKQTNEQIDRYKYMYRFDIDMNVDMDIEIQR